jgi:archaemetzincin
MTPLGLSIGEDMDASLAAAATDALETVYPVAVSRLPAIDPVAAAYEPKRNQFNAPLVLKQFLTSNPNPVPLILAVIPQDIFIPMLTFVFGQAQLKGRAAIVSVARLRQEFYGLPPDPPLLIERLRKEVVHEVGHLWGLMHCDSPACAMRLSTNVWNLDRKGERLCSGCSAILLENVS